MDYNRDTLYNIMLNAPNPEELCMINKNTLSICNDLTFWTEKFNQYGIDINKLVRMKDDPENVLLKYQQLYTLLTKSLKIIDISYDNKLTVDFSKYKSDWTKIIPEPYKNKIDKANKNYRYTYTEQKLTMSSGVLKYKLIDTWEKEVKYSTTINLPIDILLLTLIRMFKLYPKLTIRDNQGNIIN